jgi:PAS domain S-box-containing protein
MSLSSLLAHFDPADRSQIVAGLGEASDQGVAEYECDLHAMDGVRRRLLMRGTRGKAADGRAVVAGISFDITQLRAAEEARGESEALFRQGFDNSPIGMVLTDPVAGRYLQVNDAFCRLVGRGRDELLALSFHDLAHPDDAAAVAAARARMAAGAVTHHEGEKRYLRPDGSLVWTSAHTVPVYHANGEVRGFFCQLVDLTARKEREQQLMRDASDLERLEQTRSALADDRLILHAQPIIDLQSDGIVGLELLVRLRDEEGRILPPADFLPVAERYGLIREIDQWVAKRAVELAATGAPVEINLSAASVGDEEMLQTIRDALQRTGADPALVIFEVTETALMADLDRGRMFSNAVRDLGCRFALDDFGTGYGTFTYLKHIPVDFLKIDIEFVRDLLSNRDDERLVRAIVAMARDLGKTTIAEGVEDAATLERLRELGVDHAQGYHIGRPAEIGLPVPAVRAA